MGLSGLQRRALAWLALWAMLMLFIGPLTSRLLASPMPSCHTANSMAQAGQHAHAPVLSIDACAYCSMQSDLPALPPLPRRQDLPAQLVRFAAPLFFLAPRPLFAWLAARSRAPPRA